MNKFMKKLAAMALICALLMPYEGWAGATDGAWGRSVVCLAAESDGADESNIEKGATKSGTAVESNTENGAAESSTADESNTENGAAESSTADESNTENGAAESSTADESNTENGAAESSTADESNTESGEATESSTADESQEESGKTTESTSADETKKQNDKKTDSSTKVKKNALTPSAGFSMAMYKGEKTRLEFANVGGASKVSFKSSAKKVVSVTSAGVIKARRCGLAKITVTMKKGSQKMKAVITIKVTYSSGLSNTYREKSWKRQASNKKMPIFTMSRELQKGKTAKWKLTGIEKKAVVTYKTNNKKVCTISQKGIIKAVGLGNAVVSVTIRQNQMTYVYRMRIHTVKSTKKTLSVSQKTVDRYIGKSGFIGSSIGQGQQMYFNSQGSGFLGSPVMMVRKSYSFAADRVQNSNYMITYKGQPMQAKEAVRKSGIKRVYINMGTNDFYSGADYVRDCYVAYLEGIRAKNPDVVIFIESMTPVRKNRKYLNNSNINKLNKMMAAYADTQKDMYFIDVSTSLKDSSGMLKSSYCSDNYCHLTMSGYASWTNDLVAYMKEFLAKEQTAKDAIRTAKESGLKADKAKALKLVKSLGKGKVKTELLKKVKKL